MTLKRLPQDAQYGALSPFSGQHQGFSKLSQRVQKLGVGLDRAAIAKIERNLRYVANYELAALAKTFAVSPVRLLCWD